MERHSPAAVTVVQRKRSFLSTLALGVSATLVTLILCLAAVLIYGMNIADRKTDSLSGLVQMAVRGLPDLEKALPPVLADAFHDERRPDYASRLALAGRLAPFLARDDYVRPVLEVRNQGSETVTVLAVNAALLDEAGAVLHTWSSYAATPLAVEGEWPGPLLPGGVRHVPLRAFPLQQVPPDRLRVEVEVSEVRLWKPEPRVQEPQRPERPEGKRERVLEADRPL